MESEITKLRDSYKLSLKNAEPYGDLVGNIYNVNFDKEELVSLYKTLDSYIQSDNELLDTLYSPK